MKRLLLIIASLVATTTTSAQIDSIVSRLSFNADFRFRVEQDWNSRKSDGTFRTDRTRLRYRLRAGTSYEASSYAVGFRIRTGNPRKQQDPQVTLGDGNKEFGTLPIGIEKAYFQSKWRTFNFWVGKNAYPFEKNNELFWSDNVYPEGVFLEKRFKVNSNLTDHISIKGGHYIIATANRSFNEDSFFQGFQISSSFLDQRLALFPSFYVFQNIPDIPDGNDTFLLDYAIAHMGAKIRLLNSIPLDLELDYYKNLQNYGNNDAIPNNFKKENTGFVIALKYGDLTNKKDWLLTARYANLQRFSAVDFLAQNDWARWDYTSSGSPDGRLTNYGGVELVAGYKLQKKINLIVKYYFVEQLVPFGIDRENGSRIRFDIDVKF